jgi:molybdopterin molybdotransferase
MEFQEMISAKEADERISRLLTDYAPITLPLSQCAGRILRQPLIADRAQPPFDRVAMDGIAIASSAYASGLRRFAIEGMQTAGEPSRTLISNTGCLEVMTGAVLPVGADCVIPVEELLVAEGYATILENTKPNKPSRATPSVTPFRNVHRKGSDCDAGAIIVPAGTVLTSPHLGAAAAFGFPFLQVANGPSVAIVGTGDELVDPDKEPAPYQIRRSNTFAIAGALRRNGIDRIELLHARDEPSHLRRSLESVLGKYEVLILTGGVSMGKTDFVPGTLQELGVQPIFHKIRQKPGKPFWFGISATGTPIFALPGNPASALVCLHRYVLPALRKSMGYQGVDFVPAVLATDTGAPGKFVQFRPVLVSHDQEGRLRTTYVTTQGSGDFSGWARSDGFIELPAGDAPLVAGSMVRYRAW